MFRWINGRDPRQYGLDFGLWTRKVVVELIAKKFEVRLGVTAVGELLAKLGPSPQKPLQRALSAIPRPSSGGNGKPIRPSPGKLRSRVLTSCSGTSPASGPTRSMARPGVLRGHTPVVQRPGQRQSFSAASAVDANGAFWFCTYDGALNAELFIELLQQMMKYRRKPVHLVLDSLPAHKKALVRDYVAATEGRLTLHFLPGYAPDLNPDELVWSHVKRTGIARRPLQQGEKLREKIEEQLAKLQQMPHLVRSFFRAPSVAYIADC